MALVVLKTRGNDFKRLIMLSTVQKPAELVYAAEFSHRRHQVLMARQQLSPLSRSIFAATSAAARRMVSVIDMTLLGRGVGLVQSAFSSESASLVQSLIVTHRSLVLPLRLEPRLGVQLQFLRVGHVRSERKDLVHRPQGRLEPAPLIEDRVPACARISPRPWMPTASRSAGRVFEA